MAKGFFTSLKGVDAFGKVCYIRLYLGGPVTNVIIVLDDRGRKSQNSNRRSLWVLLTWNTSLELIPLCQRLSDPNFGCYHLFSYYD